MSRTFVIAECCSSWRFGPESQHLDNAYRMIAAAKECDADAAKFQLCTDPVAMSQRRNDYNPANYEILNWPLEWTEKLKELCDKVGIEWMCTTFLAKDIFRVAPLVKRFKVASAESSDAEFIYAHKQYNKEVIASYGWGDNSWNLGSDNVKPQRLLCVVSYPTPIDQLNLRRFTNYETDGGGPPFLWDGLSDHTTSVLTGALAVAAGATVIEKHVKLRATPDSNPDAPHSLVMEPWGNAYVGDKAGDIHYDHPALFQIYVKNIREAELAMGTGENVEQVCEIPNRGRRVKS